jgi:hypothetical protein
METSPTNKPSGEQLTKRVRLVPDGEWKTGRTEVRPLTQTAAQAMSRKQEPEQETPEQ